MKQGMLLRMEARKMLNRAGVQFCETPTSNCWRRTLPPSRPRKAYQYLTW